MIKKKKKTPENEKNKSDIDAPPPVQKINNNILRNEELPNFQKKINEYFSNLQPEKAELLSPSELLDEFEEHIVQAAHDVAAREPKKTPRLVHRIGKNPPRCNQQKKYTGNQLTL